MLVNGGAVLNQNNGTVNVTSCLLSLNEVGNSGASLASLEDCMDAELSGCDDCMGQSAAIRATVGLREGPKGAGFNPSFPLGSAEWMI